MLTRWWSFLLVGFAWAAPLSAQVEEYRVKAYFLYNFTRYVQWPPEAFRGPADPMTICVLGENPFGKALEEAVRGNVVESRPLAIRPVSGSPSGLNCQVLFIGAVERKQLPGLAAALRGSPVLIVADSEGSGSEGAVINFKLIDGKVRFEINPEAAAQQHLRISSILLSLALIVTK